MSRSSLLQDLQKVDGTSDAVAVKLRRVEAALRGTKALREARARSEERAEALAEVERELRRIREERAKVQARIESDNQAMYSGKVKAAREVQNVQREVEALGRRLAGLEDEALGLMERRDEAEAAAVAAAEALAETERRQAEQQAALEREQARLTSARRTLSLQRERLRRAIPADDLGLYDRLRKEKGGRALSALAGSACGVCGIELPAEESHLVRTSAELVFCRGCGRILHG